jgi:hypothetical protein
MKRVFQPKWLYQLQHKIPVRPSYLPPRNELWVPCYAPRPGCPSPTHRTVDVARITEVHETATLEYTRVSHLHEYVLSPVASSSDLVSELEYEPTNAYSPSVNIPYIPSIAEDPMDSMLASLDINHELVVSALTEDDDDYWELITMPK